MAAHRGGRGCCLQEHRLCVLQQDTFEALYDVPYKRLRQFGSSSGAFRLLFKTALNETAQVNLQVPQHSQATLVIASYINAIVEREGITCKAAEVHQLVWDMETAPRTPSAAAASQA